MNIIILLLYFVHPAFQVVISIEFLVTWPLSFQLNQWDLMVSGQLLYTLKNELRQKNTRAFLVGVFPMCPSRKASCVGNFLIAEVETFHWLHPGTPSKMPL